MTDKDGLDCMFVCCMLDLDLDWVLVYDKRLDYNNSTKSLTFCRQVHRLTNGLYEWMVCIYVWRASNLSNIWIKLLTYSMMYEVVTNWFAYKQESQSVCLQLMICVCQPEDIASLWYSFCNKWKKRGGGVVKRLINATLHTCCRWCCKQFSCFFLKWEKPRSFILF